MRGKNGESKGRTAAIKIPAHGLRMLQALSCGATTNGVAVDRY